MVNSSIFRGDLKLQLAPGVGGRFLLLFKFSLTEKDDP